MRNVTNRYRNNSVFARVLAFACAIALASITPAFSITSFVIETPDGSGNDVGQPNSLALDSSDNPHVCYRDDTTHDLMYASKTGGVWLVETADGSANDAGGWVSLALDASGNAHVSYHDFTTVILMYAHKIGGVWTTETADGSIGAGLYSSLAVDDSGDPHVGYFNVSTRDLMYAKKSSGLWQNETVDGSIYNVGDYTSLALDAFGNPHIGCHETSRGGKLLYARKAAGIWTIETADSGSVGKFASLAMDAQGNPHLSYRGANSLQYARKTGGAWMIETIAAPMSGNAYNPIALGPSGDPRVVYVDDSGELKYARKSGEVWTILTVEEGPPKYNCVSSLALDSRGNPHFSYFDLTPFTLKYARSRVVAIREDADAMLASSAVAHQSSIPELLASPNPARDGVSIFWRVPDDGPSRLDVFDLSGRKIKTLASGVIAHERQSVVWDGRNESGSAVAAGIYILRLDSGRGSVANQRITFIR